MKRLPRLVHQRSRLKRANARALEEREGTGQARKYVVYGLTALEQEADENDIAMVYTSTRHFRH